MSPAESFLRFPPARRAVKSSPALVFGRRETVRRRREDPRPKSFLLNSFQNLHVSLRGKWKVVSGYSGRRTGDSGSGQVVCGHAGNDE